VQSLLAYPSIKFKIVYNDSNEPYSDRFTLKIPYCGKFLQWEVIFDGKQPNVPPDFVLEEGQEHFVNMANINSIPKWNPTNKHALLDIVLDIIELYKQYQLKLAQNCPAERLSFELSTLLHLPEIEFLFEQQDELRCIIPLPLDFLPHDSQLLETKPKLFITFYPLSNNTPEFKFANVPGSFWEIVLSHVKLPSWDKDALVVTYLVEVDKIVKRHYDELLYRKKLVNSLLETFGGVLEYDGYLYQKVSFLFDQNNFSFLAHISIPVDFPSKQPIISLQAVKEMKNNKPVVTTTDSWPYSPRWTQEEMAKRIRAWLVDSFPAFQKNCTEDPLIS